MRTLKRRRVEIVSFERERFVLSSGSMPCPICHTPTELLTIEQAGALVQLGSPEIADWLLNGLAHGIETVGGQWRVCRDSLFKSPGVSQQYAVESQEGVKE